MLQLHQLQNQIKRDPIAYVDEFTQQLKSFEAEREIFLLRPVRDPFRFLELIQFVAQVANLYPKETTDVGPSLVRLLQEQCDTLSPHVRKTIFQSLILMRNRGMVPVPILFSLGFKLFQCQDKNLREIIMKYIIADIKSLNRVKSATNVKINSEIQTIIFKVVQSNNQDICSKKGLEILIDLYRRRIWNDAKTVNVIASACYSQTTKLMIMSIHFFLGIEAKMEDDIEEAKEEAVEIDFHEHSKKTTARIRDTRKLIKKRSKQARDEQSGEDQKQKDIVPLYPAIEMLNDPQEFGEKLFKKLKACKESFDIRLLIMNLISRLIGYHKLMVLGFYSFTQRYLNSHQQHVTHILAYLVQATHDLIPPDEFVPILKTIADNFVTERRPAEVIAVGLNGIREIVVRIPSVLEEPGMADLVQDLVLYSKSRDRTALMAGRTFLNTVREMYPSLLRGKDRGRGTDKTIKPLQYGEEKVLDGVDGAELLMEEEARMAKLNSQLENEVETEKSKGTRNGEEEDGEGKEEGEEDRENEEEEDEEWEEVENEDEMEEQDDDTNEEWNDVEDERDNALNSEEEDNENEVPMLLTIEELEKHGVKGETLNINSSNSPDSVTTSGTSSPLVSRKRKREVEKETQENEIEEENKDEEWQDMEEEGEVEEENKQEEKDLDEFGCNNPEAIQEYKTILHKRRKLIASEVDSTVVFPELRRMSNKQKREYKKNIVHEKLEEAMHSERDKIREKFGLSSLAFNNNHNLDRKHGSETKPLTTDRKQRIDATRILSQEDFDKIRKLKARKEEERRNPSALRRRLLEESEQALKKLKDTNGGIEKDETDKGDNYSSDSEDENRDIKPGYMDPSTLQGYVSKKRASKEERLLRAISGKSEFEHSKHAGGLTNKEKDRKKNYLMIRKGKQALRDKHRQTQRDVMERRNKDNKAMKLKHERRKRRRL